MSTAEVQPNRARPLAPPPEFWGPQEGDIRLDPDWTDRARCCIDPTVNSNIFELDQGGDTSEVKKVCRTCPVRLECLVDVIRVHADGEGTVAQIAVCRAGFSANALKNVVKERIKDIAREPRMRKDQSSAKKLALRELREVYPEDFPSETTPPTT